MRVYGILVLGLLSAGGGAAMGATPAPAALTLRAACREAVSANREVTAARQDAAADYQEQKQIAARYWPRLQLSETYRRTDDPSIRPNMLVNQNEPADFERTDLDSWRTEAELTYVLFDFGERAAALRAASCGLSASMRRSEMVRSRAISRTVDAFLTALYAEEELRVAREESQRMETRLDLVRKQQAAGRGLEEDVLLAEYHLGRAKQQELVAVNASENARETLGWMLGRAGKVTEPLAKGSDSALNLPAGVGDPDAAESAAREDSPELGSARQEYAARLAGTDARLSERWPRLEASASWYFDDDSPFGLESDQDSYLVGVRLSWALFDGGLRRARIAEARSRAGAAGMRAAHQEREVSNLARRAAREVAEAGRSAEVMRLKVAADAAVLRRVATAHEAGRATLDELLEAQSDMADSRLAEVHARLDERRAAARLLEATGYWAKWQMKEEAGR